MNILIRQQHGGGGLAKVWEEDERGEWESTVCSTEVFIECLSICKWACVFFPRVVARVFTTPMWYRDQMYHIGCCASLCVSVTVSEQQTPLCRCVRAQPCVWVCLCICVDDLDSRWMNSQVCPSFSGRIRGRWDWAWLDVSRLMSFLSLTSAATAAARAKLETGTHSWPAFTRLFYNVPQI